MTRSPGRSALPPGRKRSVAVFAYFTPEEAQRLRKRKRPGQSMSELVREALLGNQPAAERQPEIPPPIQTAAASVRRDKALFPSGCESHLVTVAPASSGQSGLWR